MIAESIKLNSKDLNFPNSIIKCDQSHNETKKFEEICFGKSDEAIKLDVIKKSGPS